MCVETLKAELQEHGYDIGVMTTMRGTEDGKIAMGSLYLLRSNSDGSYYELNADNLHDALVEAIDRLGYGIQQLSLFGEVE